jgi:tetratricopeptide (TPR) repeat protein
MPAFIQSKGRVLWKYKCSHEAAAVSEQALTLAERAIELSPGSASDYCTKGEALLDLKRYDEALVAFEYALQLNQRFERARRGKAQVFLKRRRFKEMFATARQALYWRMH